MSSVACAGSVNGTGENAASNESSIPIAFSVIGFERRPLKKPAWRASTRAIEPAAVTLAAIYVMVWGFLHLKGAVEEPVLTGAMRIVRLVVVFGVGLRLWQ